MKMVLVSVKRFCWIGGPEEAAPLANGAVAGFSSSRRESKTAAELKILQRFSSVSSFCAAGFLLVHQLTANVT